MSDLHDKALGHVDGTSDDESEAVSFEQGILDFNKERIEGMKIYQTYGYVEIGAKDLREFLYRFKDAAMVQVSTNMFYQLYIETGIKPKGFKPNKTALREVYKVPLKRINELLPGSYRSVEKKRGRK